jgi:ABC-2 type transport system permease protein
MRTVAAPLRAYVGIANRAMQNTIAYRMSYVITFASNFIAFISMFALWRAIYAGQPELAGMTWEQMKAYLMVTFVCNALLSYYSETRISGKILDGSITADLLKPLDFQKARFAETLGSTVVEGGLAAIILAAVLAATSGVMTPGPVYTLLFVLSLAASLLVKFGIVYMAGLLCFWSTGSLGIVWARTAVTNLFSGALVPLSFFPGWLEKLALALPFQSIVHTPAAIYLQQTDMAGALKLLALQWAWGAALWFAGRLMWTWAVRQITIHGG